MFDATRGVYQPKARFAYLFPSKNSALIQVRLRGSLSAAQQAQAIALIRQAVKMPMFALHYGGSYTVSGAPVVVNDLAAQLTHSIAILLLAAVAVMALVLMVVFRSSPRLLPLVIALRQNRPSYARFHVQSLNGERHEIEVTALPLVAAAGGFRGALAIFWPIHAQAAA